MSCYTTEIKMCCSFCTIFCVFLDQFKALGSCFISGSLWSEMSASFMTTINSAANEAVAQLACVRVPAGCR